MIPTPRHSATEQDRDLREVALQLAPQYVEVQSRGVFPFTVRSRVRQVRGVTCVRVFKTGEPSDVIAVNALPHWKPSGTEPGAVEIHGLAGISPGVEYTLTLKIEGGA